MSEKIFAKGIWYNKPRAKAPDYVLGSVKIKYEEFVSFGGENVNDDGFINLDILAPKDPSKNPYMVVNDWKPKTDKVAMTADEMSDGVSMSSFPSDAKSDCPFYP